MNFWPHINCTSEHITLYRIREMYLLVDAVLILKHIWIFSTTVMEAENGGLEQIGIGGCEFQLVGSYAVFASQLLGLNKFTCGHFRDMLICTLQYIMQWDTAGNSDRFVHVFDRGHICSCKEMLLRNVAYFPTVNSNRNVLLELLVRDQSKIIPTMFCPRFRNLNFKY